MPRLDRAAAPPQVNHIITSAPNSQFVGLLFVGLLLSMLTPLFFEYFPSHEPAGQELLTDGDFHSSESWHFSTDLLETPGFLTRSIIELQSEVPGRNLLAVQEFSLPESRTVMLSAFGIELVGTRDYDNVLQAPAISLIGQDSAGLFHGGFDNYLLRETGTRQIDMKSKVIVVPEQYVAVRAEVEFAGGTGVFRVDRVSVFEAIPIWQHDALKTVLLVAWCSFALAVFISLSLNSWQAPVGLVVVLGLLLILPESFKLAVLGPFEGFLGIVGIDHAILFFVGTIFALRMFKSGNPAAIIAGMVCLACCSESLQYFTTHRVPLLIDGVFNLIGILLGYAANTLKRPIRN